MGQFLAQNSNIIGTTITNLIVACFFSTGYIGYFHRLWTEIFSEFNEYTKSVVWKRIQLIILGCGVGLYLHLTTRFYFHGSIAMALEDIALFLLVVPFMYKGGFNWFERLIQVSAFVYVWIAHHGENINQIHVIFALVLTLLIIAVGQLYHDEIIDDWKYGIPYVFFIAFFFWKTLPSISMDVRMTNRIEWEAILIFVAMNITIMVFWLQSFKKTQRSQQLEQLADYDSLTGAKSYTLFQQEAKALFKTAKAQHRDLAVVEMDIDRFK
jgi:predicted signal transduction protein with EAL and GGDEF domain